MEKNIYLVVGLPGPCKMDRVEQVFNRLDRERATLVDCSLFIRDYKSRYEPIPSDSLRLRAMACHAEGEVIQAISSPKVDDVVVAIDIPSVEIALANRLPGLLNEYNNDRDNLCFLHVEPVWTAREVSMDHMYKVNSHYYEKIPREVMEKEYEEHYHTLASWYLSSKREKQQEANPYFSVMGSDCENVPHAIIVDMDDTMCFNTTGRHYVGETAHEDMDLDVPNYGALCMVWNWLDSPDRKAKDCIIVLTGRDCEKEREATLAWWGKWLSKSKYEKADILYLGRKKGSGMSTVEAKVMNYEVEVKDRYCVDFMLEDRPDIADIFRDDYGLWVFQPIKPYYGSCCF